MATSRDDIQYALKVLERLNNMIGNLNSNANHIQNQLTKLQTIIDDTAKRTKLTNGLTALDIAIAEVNSVRTILNTISTYIINNVPNLEEF